MTKVCIFHTNTSTIVPLKAFAAELMPGVEFLHIMEDSMIAHVMQAGGPDADISARIAMYVMAADRAGCDVFMTACSSIGEAVEACRRITRMKITRIDDAMAEAAVEQGTSISVLATVETTLRPTLNLVHRKAAEKGKKIEVRHFLMAEAFPLLMAGDVATHNRIVQKTALEAAKGSDLLVLAQASMAKALDGVDVPVPVLTSPERGMRHLKSVVEGLAAAR